MGNNVSQVEKDLATDRLPPDERFFGLVNFGNTCYCNSVLQALYFCKPFRDHVLQYRLTNKQKVDETLLSCLAELYFSIASQKKRVGSIAPKKFVARLRKETDIFDSYMHHDAHEFLIFLLDRAAEILQAEAREVGSASSTITSNGSVPASDRSLSIGPAADSSSLNNGSLTLNNDEFLRFSAKIAAAGDPAVLVDANGAGSSSSSSSGSTSAGNHHRHQMTGGIVTTVASESFNNNNYSNQPLTWVHEIFQGITRNETRCLNCESVSSMDETFLHLSVEIDQNQSLSACLRQFSSSETLCGECKYYCETCCSKQEAQKCMRVKKLPTILAIHLKRFNRYNNKLSYRVAFPLDLRLYNTSVDCLNAEVTYKLVAVIVHCGQSLNRGHYITIVKSTCKGQWLLFDDEHVEQFDPASFEDFFGLTCDSPKGSETGYMLFYDAQ